MNLTSLLTGAGLPDAALAIGRVALGSFFVLARFRFFFDPSKPKGEQWCCPPRHESLRNKMAHCGLKHKPMAWAWVTASVEVAAGLALLAGLLTVPAAFGLLVLLLVATRCTARQKVMEQNPVDKLDCVACYLWRVEGLYIALAVAIILAGPDAYTLDRVLGLVK